MLKARLFLVVLLVAATSSIPTQAASPATRVARLHPGHPGVSNPENDASGSAKLTIDRPNRRLCYRVVGNNMTIFHVDVRRNRDQRMVQELYHGRPSDDPIKSCRKKVSRRLLKQLKLHPKRFFVYVAEYHALGQPPSEIAGTLKRPSGG